MDRQKLRRRSVELRQAGMSYPDIQHELGVKVPKSTLAYWVRDVSTPDSYQEILKEKNRSHLAKARRLSHDLRKAMRKEYLGGILRANASLEKYLNDPGTAKLILVTLYLGEGSKNPKRGGLVFGNSDPSIIRLFLRTLRSSYVLDESKFRCTVQCRADQDTDSLNDYWSQLTKIPLRQFYAPRVDRRSLGKKTFKKEYRGVCRIDYFSAKILIDLLSGIKVLTRGL